jgi:hypothetical protein
VTTYESHLTSFLPYFRLQEAILLIPCGITVLMDMLMDREVSLSILFSQHTPLSLSEEHMQFVICDIAILVEHIYSEMCE